VDLARFRGQGKCHPYTVVIAVVAIVATVVTVAAAIVAAVT
jgi:hypothetical protein